MSSRQPGSSPAGPLDVGRARGALTAQRLARWTSIGFAVIAAAAIGGVVFYDHQQRGLGLMVLILPVLLVLLCVGGLALMPLRARARDLGTTQWVWWSVVVVIAVILSVISISLWSTPAWNPPAPAG